MMGAAYWNYLFRSHKMSEKASDASYPLFESACRIDVVERHIAMTKFFMKELE
jgi:hypothetical protein